MCRSLYSLDFRQTSDAVFAVSNQQIRTISSECTRHAVLLFPQSMNVVAQILSMTSFLVVRSQLGPICTLPILHWHAHCWCLRSRCRSHVIIAFIVQFGFPFFLLPVNDRSIQG